LGLLHCSYKQKIGVIELVSRQDADVCTIVAKDTLDDILWKHVENKFRDLGSSSRVRKSMKMVVHKTYRGSDELRESLEVERMDFDDEDSTRSLTKWMSRLLNWNLSVVRIWKSFNENSKKC
jgi:hypothetical protein